MKTTIQKGEIAELRFQLRAIEKGMTVSRPTTSCPYDFVLDDGDSLRRVQIKYADGRSSHSDGSVLVRLSSPSVGRRSGRACYRDGEVDLVVVYLPSVGGLVALEPNVFDGRSTVTIRISRPKNNQSKGVLLASDVEW